jgi:hypothetical protein
MKIGKGIAMSILPTFSQTDEQRQAKIRQNVLRQHAQMGGHLFGPIPKGHQRQFFCLDEYAWVWHEDWTDANGQHRTLTTRYEIRPNGIFKTQNGGSYMSLSEHETNNLIKAAKLYLKNITEDYYKSLQLA